MAASFSGFASLGQAWNEYETSRTGNRIQELFENVQHELGRIKDTLKIHEDLIARCFDFPEILELTIDKVRREFSEEKRKLYAVLLTRLTLKGDTMPSDDKTAVLHEFESISPIDVRALRLFANRGEVTPSELNKVRIGLAGTIEEMLEQFVTILAKLESRGLIMQTMAHNGAVMIPHGVSQHMARWQQGRFRILPAGQRLLDLLERGDREEGDGAIIPC